MGGDIIYHLTAALGMKSLLIELPACGSVQNALFQTLSPVDKAGNLRLKHVSLYDIPGIVAKHRYGFVQMGYVGLQGGVGSRLHGRLVCPPGLPVQKLLSHAELRVQLLPDPVHQLRGQKTHQVKAKPVQMVFSGPIQNGIHNVVIHHGPSNRHIASTGRTVGQRAVLIPSGVITRHGALQPGIRLMRMIIHHIHHHAKPRLVQRLNHLLALPDTHCAVPRIRGKGTLRHIVIYRIISPVELTVIRLVQPAEIKKGQKVHMGDAQRLQISHAGGISLSQCGILHRKRLVFPPVFLRYPAVGIMGKIFDVKLIDNRFRFSPGRSVLLEALRVRAFQIHRHASAAVVTAGSCVRIRGAHDPSFPVNQIIIVHPMHIPGKFHTPDSPFSRSKRHTAAFLLRSAVRRKPPDMGSLLV